MPEQETISLEEYKKFFDETPIALVRIDLKTGSILMANVYAARMFGYDSVEEFKSKAKTIDFQPLEELKRMIRMIRKQGKVEKFEIQMKLPTGTIWVSACLHINCGGTCMEGSLTDITEFVALRDKQLTILKEVGRKLDKKIAALAY